MNKQARIRANLIKFTSQRRLGNGVRQVFFLKATTIFHSQNTIQKRKKGPRATLKDKATKQAIERHLIEMFITYILCSSFCFLSSLNSFVLLSSDAN